MGKEEDAGEESEEEQEADIDGEPPAKPDLAYLHENVAETTVAVDPVHHAGPGQMMQALQGTLGALKEQAARIAKNEKAPTVANINGALQPVADEGGRHTLRNMVLDVQSAARGFDERSQVVLEKAQAGAEAAVCATGTGIWCDRYRNRGPWAAFCATVTMNSAPSRHSVRQLQESEPLGGILSDSCMNVSPWPAF